MFCHDYKLKKEPSVEENKVGKEEHILYTGYFTSSSAGLYLMHTGALS